MENLEAQDKIINLGKLFVEELKLEPGVDTFSRWMAHYLAEKISLAEDSKGTEKEEVEKECCDVILKLWQHRNSLPNERRPFQNFEPILDMLSRMNPEKEKPYFYNRMRNEALSELETDNINYKSLEEWTNIAKEIDQTARIWIEYALSRAANSAKNEKTKEWINNAVDLPDNGDTRIINILLKNNPSFDIENYDKDDFSKKYAIEKLKKRILQLQKYSKINKVLLKVYKSELENIQKTKK